MLLADMVLLTNFNSTFDSSIKDGISLAFLRVGDFAQGAPRKDLINVPFVKRFKAPTLWSPDWTILIVIKTVLLKITCQ